jgi:hypothetical protein
MNIRRLTIWPLPWRLKTWRIYNVYHFCMMAEGC